MISIVLIYEIWELQQAVLLRASVVRLSVTFVLSEVPGGWFGVSPSPGGVWTEVTQTDTDQAVSNSADLGLLIQELLPICSGFRRWSTRLDAISYSGRVLDDAFPIDLVIGQIVLKRTNRSLVVFDCLIAACLCLGGNRCRGVSSLDLYRGADPPRH